jgi:hypothetical protein
VGKLQSQLKGALHNVLNFSHKYISPLLPIIVVGSALWFQRDSIAYMGAAFWRSVRGARLSLRRQAPSPISNGEFKSKQPQWRPFGGAIKIPLAPSEHSPSDNRVDLGRLSQVYRLSWWDQVVLNAKTWNIAK